MVFTFFPRIRLIWGAVYLHYYEDYTAPEIGKILGKNVNTVYTLLNRARQTLREKLGGDGDE